MPPWVAVLFGILFIVAGGAYLIYLLMPYLKKKSGEESAAAPENGEPAALPENGETAAAPENGESAAAPGNEDGKVPSSD